MISSKQIADLLSRPIRFDQLLGGLDGWSLELAGDGEIEHVPGRIGISHSIEPGDILVGNSVATEIGILEEVGTLIFRATLYLDQAYAATPDHIVAAGVGLHGTDGAGVITGKKAFVASLRSVADGAGDADLSLVYGDVTAPTILVLGQKLSSLPAKTHIQMQLVSVGENFNAFIYVNDSLKARVENESAATYGFDTGARPVLHSFANMSAKNELANIAIVQTPMGGGGGGSFTRATDVSNVPGAPADATASYATATVGSGTWTALAAGSLGRDLTVEYVQRNYIGSLTSVQLVDDGEFKNIIVYLGLGATYLSVKNAVAASPEVSSLVAFTYPDGSDGLPASATKRTRLRGGLDSPTVAQHNTLIASLSTVLTQFNELLGSLRDADIIAPSLVAPVVNVTPGNKQALVEWGAVDYALNYRVYYGLNSPVDADNALGSFDTDEVSYVVGSLENEVTYYFAVSALRNATVGPISDTVVGLPRAADAPTGLSLLVASQQLTAQWNAVAGATGYRVFWATDPGVDRDTYDGTADVGSTSHVIAGLVDGTTYYVRVEALVGMEEGLLSAPQSATPNSSQLPFWMVFNHPGGISLSVA